MGTTHGICYLELYRSKIMPKIKEIDIFLKTQFSPYKSKDIAQLLNISLNELQQIMKTNNIYSLDLKSFPLIMKNGSSELCKTFKRELECGLTKVYSPEQISYIYDIDIDIVLNAYAKMGVSKLHSGLLEVLFSNIYI